MSNDGFSVTYEECKYIVMCHFHKIPVRAFNPCGIGQGVVGADVDSLVKAKSHPNIATYTPSTGPEIMSLITGIIAARSLFDAGSPLQADLHKLKLRLERANRRFLTVESTWNALRSTFQCFSQALNSWAKSPMELSDPFPSRRLPLGHSRRPSLPRWDARPRLGCTDERRRGSRRQQVAQRL
jgi:hypothetical protein